jgi:cell division protein FtsZ
MYGTNPPAQGPFSPKITVIGVGGAGGNAVNNMISSNLEGVSFLALNTDAQALENSLATKTIQLGSEATGGLGAGARPEIGRVAAEETLSEIEAELDGVNMVFITAGMGGGTGTGAAPIVAKMAKEKGILTVGVVTKPFQFEGAQRMRLAEAGIEELAQYVDTLIVIPNQNLFRIANEKTTFADAFRMADEVLQSGVRGVTDLMVVPGMINLDFADVRSATSEMGKAMMGTGEATGERRAIEAAEQAINNPLLDDVSMKGARSVIINITGGHDLTLFEIEEACNRINDEVDPDATIIFGSTYDDSLDGTMRVTVVATGIEAEIGRRQMTRPIRATNTNMTPTQQTNTGQTQETTKDHFVARYPEPTRVSATMASSTSVAAHAPAQPQSTQYVETPQVEAASAVASAEKVVQEQPQQETGYAEPEYVAEGSAMRMVMPQQQEAGAVIPPAAPSVHNAASAGSSMTLNPPKQPKAGMPARETRKTPSLFERITGVKNRDELIESTHEETDTTSSSSTGKSDSFMSGLTAERKTVVSTYDTPATQGEQGTLNVDVPKKNEGIQAQASDLDIPAFLRRQIS